MRAGVVVGEPSASKPIFHKYPATDWNVGPADELSRNWIVELNYHQCTRRIAETGYSYDVTPIRKPVVVTALIYV
jgi:hypothetical protein